MEQEGRGKRPRRTGLVMEAMMFCQRVPAAEVEEWLALLLFSCSPE